MRQILVLALLLAGCAPATGARERTSTDESHGRWVDVLQRLDERRERAYLRGDPALLDGVYVDGAAVRSRDARLIRAYARRGLVVDAVPMRLLDVEVASRAAGRVRLRVVDRLGPVRVRPAGGAWQAMPRDGPTERIITLQRLATGWRIARILRTAG